MAYRKDSSDRYRSKIRRFTLQFSLKDTVVRAWVEQQPDKGQYLKTLMYQDMLNRTQANTQY